MWITLPPNSKEAERCADFASAQGTGWPARARHRHPSTVDRLRQCSHPGVWDCHLHSNRLCTRLYRLAYLAGRLSSSLRSACTTLTSCQQNKPLHWPSAAHRTWRQRKLSPREPAQARRKTEPLPGPHHASLWLVRGCMQRASRPWRVAMRLFQHIGPSPTWLSGRIILRPSSEST